MTGLCRVCDCALSPTDERFVQGTTTWAEFSVYCSTCQATYTEQRESTLGGVASTTLPSVG